jgi:hypothetical protein
VPAGRPSKIEVKRRQGRVVRFLARATLVSEESMKRVAKGLGVGLRAIQLDLEALAREEDVCSRIPSYVASSLETANTAEELWRVERRLVVDVARGSVPVEDAEFFVEACRKLRQSLKAARASAPDGTVFTEDMHRVEAPEAKATPSDQAIKDVSQKKTEAQENQEPSEGGVK